MTQIGSVLSLMKHDGQSWLRLKREVLMGRFGRRSTEASRGGPVILTLCVCEGEFDAMLVLQELGTSVAAIGSTTSITSDLYWLALCFPRLVLIPDNDEAGAKMTQKWRESFPNVQVLKVPAHDVTAFVQGGGNLSEWWLGEAEVPEWVKE